MLTNHIVSFYGYSSYLHAELLSEKLDVVHFLQVGKPALTGVITSWPSKMIQGCRLSSSRINYFFNCSRLGTGSAAARLCWMRCELESALFERSLHSPSQGHRCRYLPPVIELMSVDDGLSVQLRPLLPSTRTRWRCWSAQDDPRQSQHPLVQTLPSLCCAWSAWLLSHPCSRVDDTQYRRSKCRVLPWQWELLLSSDKDWLIVEILVNLAYVHKMPLWFELR